MAGGPIHGHLAHDEHHDFSSLVVWQVSSEEAWQEDTRSALVIKPTGRSEAESGCVCARTDGLNDGVLDDSLLALFAAAGRNAGAGVPPGALAQLEVHAHPQVFEQRVEDLQHCGTCHHTHAARDQ